MLQTLPPAWIAGAEPGYYLGTDSLGRDVLSRIIYATRPALIVAIVASSGGLRVAGRSLGLLAGFFGGWTDRVISRLVDIWMAFPPVLLSILLVAVMGPGLSSVIIAIAVIDWTRFCRVVRAEAMQQRRMDYVDSAKVAGYGTMRIMLREVLPNVAPAILVLFSLEMGIAVIVEAILSFVNLSISTDDPTWGSMIAEGRGIVHQAWWVLVFPLDLPVPHRARLQPVRRGPEGTFRSGDAMSAPFLAIESLSVRLRRGGAGPAAAAGVDRGSAGRSPRACRRERRRQEHDRPRDLRHSAARRRSDRRRGAARRNVDLFALSDRERRRLVGASAALIPQDPLTALNPSKRIESQMTDRLTRILGLPAQAGEGAGARPARGSANPRAGARLQELSARAFRRHAPARADRLGLRRRAETDRRRRTDDRARRHRAEADFEADRRDAAPARNRAAVRHPQSRRRRQDLPAGQRALRRQSRRADRCRDARSQRPRMPIRAR